MDINILSEARAWLMLELCFRNEAIDREHGARRGLTARAPQSYRYD
jgi:hypothetical protein